VADEHGLLRVDFELGAAEPNEGHGFDALEAQIERRRTDRRLGGRTPLSEAQRRALEEAARSVAGVDLALVTARPDIETLARLVGEGDRLRMLDPGLSREMFAELRWSRQEAEATGDGLEVESLALSAVDRTGLELCRSPEALALVARWGLGAGLARLGRRWAATSSALGLLTTQGTSRTAYLEAGRAVQRLWLAATHAGLALHPLTFLPYAFALAQLGEGSGLAPATLQGLAKLRPNYERVLGLDGRASEVFLFRLSPGGGDGPSSLRRPLDQVLTFAGA
jgi:hypothetical protein